MSKVKVTNGRRSALSECNTLVINVLVVGVRSVELIVLHAFETKLKKVFVLSHTEYLLSCL